jgi:hypothetical protein
MTPYKEPQGWEKVRKEFKLFVTKECQHHDPIQCDCHRIIDWWLAKLSTAYALGREEEKKGLRKEIEFFFKHETAYSGVGVRFKDMCTALEMKLLSLLSTDNNNKDI